MEGRSSEELIEELKKRGYDAVYDACGTVKAVIDPYEQDEDELRRIIQDVIGWDQSWGIQYTRRPPDWDQEQAAGQAEKQRAPRATKRDEIRKAPTGRKTGKTRKEPSPAVADGVIPGQMNIFDFL